MVLFSHNVKKLTTTVTLTGFNCSKRKIKECESTTLRSTRSRYKLLPSANEVAEKYCFHKSVSRILPTGRVHTSPMGRHPWADTSLGRHPLGRPPPHQTATSADGTHPTGMHSCCDIIVKQQRSYFIFVIFKSGKRKMLVSRETDKKIFMAAASLGDLQVLHQMVARGADVNMIVNRRGALSMAAEKGHTASLAFLLREGAVVNQLDEKGTTPLGYAVEKNHIKCMLLLLEAGADVIEAAENGDAMCVSFLLQAGTDVNEIPVMGNTPLIAASSKGHFQCVEILIQAGANVNVRNYWPGDTALTLAAQGGGHYQCVHNLIQGGADVNRSSFNGISPLMEATRHGRHECVLLLTIAGANVNETARPIVEASRGGHLQSIEILVKAGAGVNLKDPFRQTALIAAIGEQHIHNVYHNIYSSTSGEHAKCINFLLEAGADANQVVGPPLGLASLTCNVKVLRRLLYAGAKINVALHDLRKRGDTDRVARLQVVRLLFAAGETLVFVDVGNHGYSYGETENYLQLNMMNICRRAIRKHLLKLDPHENLFVRVPRFGLSAALQRFLLYYLIHDNDD